MFCSWMNQCAWRNQVIIHIDILYNWNRVSSPKWKQVISKSHYDKLRVKDFSSFSAREQNYGVHFLHVFLQNGRPVAKLGCSGIHVLTAAAPQNIKNNTLVPIIVRWEWFHLQYFFLLQNIIFLVFGPILKYVNILKTRLISLRSRTVKILTLVFSSFFSCFREV